MFWFRAIDRLLLFFHRLDISFCAPDLRIDVNCVWSYWVYCRIHTKTNREIISCNSKKSKLLCPSIVGKFDTESARFLTFAHPILGIPEQVVCSVDRKDMGSVIFKEAWLIWIWGLIDMVVGNPKRLLSEINQNSQMLLLLPAPIRLWFRALC